MPIQEANSLIAAVNWPDAQRRVTHAYRQWLRSVSPSTFAISVNAHVADWEMMLGARDPTDVLAQHAGLEDANESTAGVRET